MAGTTVKTFSPIGENGLLRAGYMVSSSVSGGSCGAASDVLNDAYRCGIGDGLWDPCWAERTGSFVCVLDPWETSVDRLVKPEVMSTAPARKDRGELFAVETATGLRCRSYEGAHGNVGGTGDGAVIDYLCQDDVGLLRDIDRTGPIWFAEAAGGAGDVYHKLPGRISLTVAWFA